MHIGILEVKAHSFAILQRSSTTEAVIYRPRGSIQSSEPNMSAASGRFVIQKHQATHLHYDFRLEMDNVLKSWAVPKEPPTQPGLRRLAVQVEDHELNYIDFEGTIPKGEYGAGTVDIWDKGTYTLLSRSDKIIEFSLNGSRLKGNYALVNFKENNWLLLKKKT